jgi:UDP-N-acetylglucosamine transferase subunit ALG13
VSYVAYNKALVAAAKANNIEVIEIQHGTISPYHLGYNFPNCEHELDYFPDTFYSFGDYWSEIVDFPIDKKKVILYGFPYMKTRKAKYKNIKKKEKQILFISQGAIGKELARFAYDAAQILKDYSIVYKLHPGEYDRWEKEYKELVLANKLDNFEIVDNNKIELYNYFAESEYLVGVFSTAIYEGLAFDCKTILVDLPGIEYMKYLIEKEIVVMVEGIDDLKDRIKHFKSKDYDENYFFA